MFNFIISFFLEAAYEILSTNWDNDWEIDDPYDGDDAPKVPLDMNCIEEEIQDGEYYHLYYFIKKSIHILIICICAQVEKQLYVKLSLM